MKATYACHISCHVDQINSMLSLSLPAAEGRVVEEARSRQIDIEAESRHKKFVVKKELSS